MLTAPRATGQVLWKRKAPAAYLVIFTSFFNFFLFSLLIPFYNIHKNLETSKTKLHVPIIWL